MIKLNAVNRAKAVPIRFIVGFEKEYLHNTISDCSYELIDTIEFELSKNNPSEFYEYKNGAKDIVFSFVETKSPINFSLYNKNNAEAYSVGFLGDTAVKVTLDLNDDYRFEYKLGFEDDTNQNSDLVDFASGKINIYQAV